MVIQMILLGLFLTTLLYPVWTLRRIR